MTRRNIWFLTRKTQSENLTWGQAKWPHPMYDPDRSCCILPVASWKDKCNVVSHTALALFCQELLMQTFSWRDVVIYEEVIWAVWRSPDSSCAWSIAELPWNGSWELDVSWMLKTRGMTCNSDNIDWVVTWRWELWSIAQLKTIESRYLQTLFRKFKSKVRLKSDLYRKNCRVKQEKLGMPPPLPLPSCGRGLI